MIVCINGVMGGTDLQNFVDRQGGFEVAASAGKRMDTLHLSLFDKYGELAVPDRAEIVIYDAAPGTVVVDPPTGTPNWPHNDGKFVLSTDRSGGDWTPRLFAGYAATVSYKVVGPERVITLSAQDYTFHNKTTIVNKSIPRGYSDAQIIKQLYQQYRPDIDTSAVVASIHSNTDGASTWQAVQPTVSTTKDPQGNWVGLYGSDGYALSSWSGGGATDLVSMPLCTLVLDNATHNAWSASTTTIQTLQSPDTLTRQATCWYDPTEARLSLHFPAAYTGTLHLYALDWDTNGRREIITVTDSTGPHVANINFDFFFGVWIHLPITVTAGGVVSIRVTNSPPGTNAVLSGIFLGGLLPAGAATTTLLAGQPRYGAARYGALQAPSDRYGVPSLYGVAKYGLPLPLYPGMPEFRFGTHTLEQMMDRLTKISHAQYRIDYYKRLFYQKPGTRPAPFALSDTPGVPVSQGPQWTVVPTTSTLPFLRHSPALSDYPDQNLTVLFGGAPTTPATAGYGAIATGNWAVTYTASHDGKGTTYGPQSVASSADGGITPQDFSTSSWLPSPNPGVPGQGVCSTGEWQVRYWASSVPGTGRTYGPVGEASGSDGGLVYRQNVSSSGPAPLPPNTTTWSARYTRTANFSRAGNWVFHGLADDGFRLYIDGNLILDAFYPTPPHDSYATANLTAGNHTMVVDYFESYGPPRALWMEIKQSRPVFTADYVRTANVTAPGTYNFHVVADDAVQLYVDGTLVIDALSPPSYSYGSIALAAGNHVFELKYHEAPNGPNAKLSMSITNTVPCYGDTWIWDGLVWTQLSPYNSPPPRAGAMMAYDKSTKRVLMFGGAGASGFLSDTWAFTHDGVNGNWVQLTSAANPSGRSSGGIAANTTNGQIVLYGGLNQTGVLNDTWAWTGQWVQQLIAGPPARSNPAVAYLSTANKFALFGGLNAAQVAQTDTWLLDVAYAAWTNPTPATHPTAAVGGGPGVSDTARGMMVLFEPDLTAAGTPLHNEWTYDGTTWVLAQVPDPAPASLTETTGYALTYESGRNDVVLIGPSTSTVAATFKSNVTSIQSYGVEELSFNPDASGLTNRVWVVGSRFGSQQTSYTINPLPTGYQTQFLLPGVPHDPSKMKVTVNGISFGRVGVAPIDGTVDTPAGWAAGVKTLVVQDSSLLAFKTPPPAGATVVLTGAFRYPVIEVITDQRKLAATGGNVFEAILRDKRIEDATLAVLAGQSYLTYQGATHKGGTLTIRQRVGMPRLEPGMVIPLKNGALFKGLLPGGGNTMNAIINQITTTLADTLDEPYDIKISFSDLPEENNASGDIVDMLQSESSRVNAALDQTQPSESAVADQQTINEAVPVRELVTAYRVPPYVPGVQRKYQWLPNPATVVHDGGNPSPAFTSAKLNLTAYLQLQTQHFSAGLAPFGDLLVIAGGPRHLGGALSPAGALLIVVGRGPTGTLSFTGTLALTARVLKGTLSFSGSLSQTSQQPKAALTFSGSLTTQKVHFFTVMTAGLTFTGSAVHGQLVMNKNLNGGLTPGGNLAIKIRPVRGNLGFSGSLTRQYIQSATVMRGGLNFLGNMVKSR